MKKETILYLDKNNVIDLYKNGNTMAEISKKLEVAKTTISNYLILKNCHASKTIADYSEVVELYKNGFSITQISQKTKRARSLISRHLLLAGIDIVNKTTILNFNDRCFDVIDTEEKAYWLGFIYADGAIYSNSNRVEVSLKLSDRSHLEKLNSFLQCSLPIKTDSYRARLLVSSNHFKQQLIFLGAIPNKSLTLKFPKQNQVPDHLLTHFVRGYFDGDGCVTTYHTKYLKKEMINVSIIGTNLFLSKLLDHFKLKVNLRQTNKNGSPDCQYFMISANKAINFLEILYKDSTIHLERKKNKYVNHIAVLKRNL